MTDPQQATPTTAQPDPAAEATAPVKKSRLPLLAIIFAGVALLFAVISVTAAFAWPFAVTAIVLAIIALVKKSQPKLLAILAIIIAPLAWIISIVVFTVALASGIGSALEEVIDGKDVDPGQSEEQPQEEEVEAGTRDNPLALGSTVEGSEWTVVVNSVSFDALDAILAENMFNEVPDEGYEYILVNYTVTYTGNDPEGLSPVFVSIEYVTPQGNTIDDYATFVVAPGAIDLFSTLYEGATVSGNTVIAVPIADAGQGVLAVSPGLLEGKVFFSVK